MMIAGKWYPDLGKSRQERGDLASLSNMIQQMIYMGYQKKEDEYDDSYKIIRDRITNESADLRNLRN